MTVVEVPADPSSSPTGLAEVDGLAVLAAPETNPALSYLRRLAPGSRRSIITAMRSILACLDAPDDPFAFPWHRLTYAHTSAIRSELAARYAPRTANHALSCLRGILKQAWRLELVDAETYNRAVDLEQIDGSRLLAGRALTAGEIRALFAVCAADPSVAGRRDAAVIAVLYGCGLRCAELVGVDIDAYDTTSSDIKLVGKRNKQRLVHVTGGAVAALAGWLACRGNHPGALFYAVNKGGAIAEHGMSTQALAAMLAKRAAAAHVASFSPHDLRRTMISDLLDAGADISTVQRIAGHSDPKTTASYDRRPDAVARKAAGLLEIPFVEAAAT